MAFETYKRLHGDLYAVQGFVVPSDDSEWPEGGSMALGWNCHEIRNTRIARQSCKLRWARPGKPV
jgi:hypothetical protein